MEILLHILIIAKWVYCITVPAGMLLMIVLKDGIEEQHRNDEIGSQGGLILWFAIFFIPILNTLFLMYVLYILLGPEPEQEEIDPDT